MVLTKDRLRKHENPHIFTGTTQKTANFQAGNGIFIRISANALNPVKYTDPDGKWQVYSRLDKQTGKTNYFMTTPRSYTAVIRWASNWIPAGSYIANMQNGLSNFSNAAAANNYRIEYDSDEAGFEGTSIALDLIGLLPAAKGVNIVQRISQIFSTKNTADSIFSSMNNDSKIRKFINSLTFSVLGGSENKEEAIIVAEAIAAGALVYDQKKLAKKGIDQNDWAKAIKDQIYGRSNKLYDSVMAGNYD